MWYVLKNGYTRKEVKRVKEVEKKRSEVKKRSELVEKKWRVNIPLHKNKMWLKIKNL